MEEKEVSGEMGWARVEMEGQGGSLIIPAPAQQLWSPNDVPCRRGAGGLDFWVLPT